MASPRLRIGRHSVQGAAYMVTTVALGRRPVFVIDDAAQALRQTLHEIDAGGGVESLAWVIMPDHLHWMFVLRESTLSAVVQRMKSVSAQGINSVLGQNGPIWQPGFYDHLLRKEEDAITQARYILANPIRSRLSERIGEYPYAWSRYGDLR